MPTEEEPIMLKRKWKVASLATALLAVIVGFAFSPAGSINAQGGDNDYVDVAVILEFPDQHSSVTSQKLKHSRCEQWDQDRL